MLFFDSNDLLTQFKLSSKQSELESSKEFYEEKIIEVKNDKEALLNDKALLEKIAREKYLMKKENEDVYIVVEE
jgi:cell division protein FtsB